MREIKLLLGYLIVVEKNVKFIINFYKPIKFIKTI